MKRTAKKGQGLVLLALGALVLIAGVSAYLLLTPKEDAKPAQKPVVQQPNR
ncbi:MAG: hypothetical protein KF696_07170 [Planctomycetes bacterium]|nr:hypothetical protein [Planctomycetota bacterium]MCW8135335.1 hypothetical protein [Planctomycetota bacterium]